MSERRGKNTIVHFIKKLLVDLKREVFYIIIGIFGLIMLRLVYLLMIGIVEYGLNVSMYCTTEKRYITHEENVEAAIKYYLRHQFIFNHVIIGPGEEKIFRYANIEEFLKINPECCIMKRNELSGIYFDSFYWRAFEGVSDVIDVYAKEGFIKDGSVEWTESHYPATLVADRCGKIREATFNKGIRH